MSFTHSILTTAKNSVGVFGTATVNTTGDAEDNFNFSTAATTTNDPHILVVAHAPVVDVIISASAPCTILTNSTTSPGNTFTFTAAGILNGPNLFTSDVTELFITNPGSAAVSVNVSILRNI